jgi:hypothetical protein
MLLHLDCPKIQSSVQNASLQAGSSHHGHKPVLLISMGYTVIVAKSKTTRRTTRKEGRDCNLLK